MRYNSLSIFEFFIEYRLYTFCFNQYCVADSLMRLFAVINMLICAAAIYNFVTIMLKYPYIAQEKLSRYFIEIIVMND